MADWNVRLFGKPSLQCYGKPWSGSDATVAMEIFLFLLSHRRIVHNRETLASLLWGECSTYQSRKHLRQTLWRLRSCDSLPLKMKRTFLLSIDKDHIQLNPEIEYWVDTELFEQTYLQTKGCQNSDETNNQRMREAVQLYRGGFLEGYWYDWCLFERERFQNMYMTMLDKLIESCLCRKSFEEGLDYGERILRLDPASERTHQQMMRLHHLSGNRTAALRQFERCGRQLKEELGVAPSTTTLKIWEQIRADGVVPEFPSLPETDPQIPLALPHLLGRLKQFQNKLTELHKQIQKEIDLVENYLPNQTD